MASFHARRGASTLEMVIVSACLALSFFELAQALFQIWCSTLAYAWSVLGQGLP